ncbi:CubicO group peptidase (beta-lactamase class C family) [Rhodopirellula rubra]|uniref:Beta-lactamase n=1 Tax=Aporhodopirellula rubra TaxID=980271 RepID=A0A7W5H428_9BACT|nr:serine hydrolase [Aporhodopirellula rubra]MBB3204728.1 CubicO group peptidase (beta-lactamase class C family) [Aporhodopirellula rubra]
MLRIKAMFVLGLLCLSSDAGAQSLASRVRDLAEPLVKTERVMGMSIGVISGGQRLTVHVGTVAKGSPRASDETVYEIGSISKVFTGLMLADAVATDRMRLDQPAGDFLPEGVEMPRWKNTAITLRHLATHRSGLPRLPDNMRDVASDNPYARYTSTQAFEFLKSHSLRRAPGAEGVYSNFAVALLGDLICRDAERSYDEQLRERITGPLKMDATSVELSDSMRSTMATPHDAGLNATSTWEFADLPGAGGIRSNIDDMLTFAQTNLDPPEGDVGDAIELAWRQHQATTGSASAMGLGWHVAGDGQTRWHNGGTGGFRSMLMINRDQKIAVVILCNTSCDAVDALATRIMVELANANDASSASETPVEVDVALEKMKRLEGRYQLAPTFIFDVRVRDGKLMVGITNQPTHQVYAKSETEWFYKVVPASLAFKMGADGKCMSLELLQNGIRQTARRVE